MSASSGDRAALAARADEVVRVASAWLRSQLGASFEQAVSIALNGSHARGELTHVSDIDYCVLFDCAHPVLAPLTLAEIIRELQQHVQTSFADEPLARRFSVFWSCLRDLSGEPCHGGRFPLYDRGLLRDHGRHLAGRQLSPASIRNPTQAEIGEAGVGFLLTEIRPQLAALGLFRPGTQVSMAQVNQFGPVLASKAVLMPIRMLYVLLPEATTRLFVGVEAAVRGCARPYMQESWWPLVEQGLAWRERFPEHESGRLEVARSLSASGRALYQCCVERHREFAVDQGLSESARELGDWSREFESA